MTVQDPPYAAALSPEARTLCDVFDAAVGDRRTFGTTRAKGEIERLELSPDESWITQLSQLADAAGYATSVADHPMAVAMDMASHESPLVRRVDGSTWLVVYGRRRSKLDAALVGQGRSRRVRRRPDSLARQLGLDPQESVEWLVIEPALPLDPLRDDGTGPKRKPLSRLLSLLRLESASVWAVVVYSLFVGVLTLATPLAVQALVNTITFGMVLQPLVVLTILLLVGLAGAGLLRVLETVVVEWLQRRLFVRAVADIVQRLTRAAAEMHDKGDGAELANRFFDVMTLQKAASSLLLDGFGLVLQTTIGLLILAFYHPLLATFAVVLILVLNVILLVLGRGTISTSVVESKAKYAVAAHLEAVGRRPLAFDSAHTADAAVTRADALTREYLTARGAHFKRVLRQTIGLVTLHAVASATLLGLGGVLVMRGQLSLGQLVAAELIVTAVVGSIAKFGKHLDVFYDATAAIDKIGELIDIPMETSRGSTLPHSDRGLAVAVSGAKMKLGGAARLRDVSLEIAAGESVALAGPPGSGKSLLLDALYGRRPLSAGRITFDDVGQEHLDVRRLRDDIALVRDVTPYNGTVLDNVTLGRPISAVTARAALTKVGICGRIDALPEGVHTRLTPSSVLLPESGRAPVALARAIVGHPRLLLIDGVLDGIDPEIQTRVLDGIASGDGSTTVLIVTHDPAVMARVDRVVTIGAGNARAGVHT